MRRRRARWPSQRCCCTTAARRGGYAWAGVRRGRYTFDIALDLNIRGRGGRGREANAWVHFAMSVGPSGVAAYIDGEPVETGPSVGYAVGRSAAAWGP